MYFGLIDLIEENNKNKTFDFQDTEKKIILNKTTKHIFQPQIEKSSGRHEESVMSFTAFLR